MALNEYLRQCDPGVLRRALLVAAVVGPTLVFVNQGPDVLRGAAVDLGKLVLTMAVPFFVASFSGMLARSHAAAASVRRELRLERDMQAVSALVRGMEEVGSRVLVSTQTVASSVHELAVVAGSSARVSAKVLDVRSAAGAVAEGAVEHMRLAHEVLVRLNGLVDRQLLEREGVECLEEDS